MTEAQLTQVIAEIKQYIEWDVTAGLIPEGVTSWEALAEHAPAEHYITEAQEALELPTLDDADIATIRRQLTDWLQGVAND